MAGRLRCSQRSSDTYDVYYDNPGLIPQVDWPPMEVSESTPWTLDKDRGDATVEHICDFIVVYIDMMVSSPLPRACTLKFISPCDLQADRNCRSIKGGTLFVCDLPRPHPSIGRRI
jgi:hypothetical protein